jgi:hypothetical protein
VDKQRRVTIPGETVRPTDSRADEKVAVGFPYGTFEGAFVESLVQEVIHDAQHHQRICNGGHFLPQPAANIAFGRNQIVQNFLNETDADWLWFIDTDQTWEPGVLERMVQSAHPTERPILGALVFSVTPGEAQEIAPTLWGVVDNQFSRITQVPKVGILEVAATGTGCVIIHRSVLEGVRDLPVPDTDLTHGDTAWPWFKYADWTNAQGKAIVMGEDLTFFLRASAAGFRAFVDTTIEVGHVKRALIGRQAYEIQPIGGLALPNFVIVPVKGHHDLTDNLLTELVEQREVYQIFVLDNGADTDPYQTSHGDLVEVLPCAGLNIHQMWNRGIERCLKVAPRCNIAVLNNDLDIGEHFLSGLAQELRADPRRLAVCPNYDGRPGTGFEPVHGICAARYDGTGGLAGFAFMVPGEMYTSGFPPFWEELQWWYGDNDMVRTIELYGGVYGIALDTTVKHLGGQTTVMDEAFQKTIAEDRAHFMRKWGLIDAEGAMTTMKPHPTPAPPADAPR